MPKALELTGLRFGRLAVHRRASKDQWGAWLWECVCDCGAVVTVRGATLSAGRTNACPSCAATVSSTTHGGSKTALYARWRAMLARCGNPRNSDYANYGGRGIAVCERWLRSFENFRIDMGETFRSDLELDRVDVDGPYGLDNCRWATRVQQQRNRRNNHRVEWLGRTATVQEWSEQLGLKPNTVVCRLRRGWDVDRALSTGVAAEVLLKVADS